MNKSSWTRLLGALFMLAGLAVCIMALLRPGIQQYVANFQSARVIGTLAVTGLAALVASALSWQRYLLALSGHRLSFGSAFYQVGLVLMGKYIPVVLGGVLARVSANSGRASATIVVGASLLEQCGALAAATLVGLSCFAGAYSPLLGIAALLTSLASAVLAPFLAAPVLGIALWTRARFRHESKGEVVAVLDPGPLRIAWLAQIAQWIAISLFAGTVIHAMAPAATATDILLLCGAYGVAVVIGIAAFMFPGGLGPREATFVWIAGGVVGYDVAIAMASALRVAMTGIDLLAGAGCILHWITHVLAKRPIQAP